MKTAYLKHFYIWFISLVDSRTAMTERSEKEAGLSVDAGVIFLKKVKWHCVLYILFT